MIIRLVSFLCFLFMPSLLSAQSFDCRDARRADEVTICEHPDLAELDIQMSKIYSRLLNRLNRSDRDQLRHEQTEWLRDRMDCGDDADCLRTMYRERINELENEDPPDRT
jgi:uncharacterized protein